MGSTPKGQVLLFFGGGGVLAHQKQYTLRVRLTFTGFGAGVGHLLGDKRSDLVPARARDQGIGFARFGSSTFPQGPRYCYGGYFPKSYEQIPNTDTLHSTI